MTELYEINVRLSDNQKKNLSNAYHKRETIVLRLTNDSLNGNDTLYVPAMVKKRLQKNRKLNKGMDIKLAKTNIRKQVGGSLLSTVLSLGMRALPAIGKTLGLSALGGLAEAGAKKLIGSGQQTGGFLIPQDKINKLIEYKHLLSTKQKQDILNALQSGSGVRIKPTKTQSGGFLGTLLASIGIPLALDLVKKMTGKGAPRIGRPPWSKNGTGAPRMGMPPPFYGTWNDIYGSGKKKKKEPRPKKERDYYWEKTVHSMAYPFWGQYCETKMSQKHTYVQSRSNKMV